MGQACIEGIDGLWVTCWGIELERCWNLEIGNFKGKSKGNVIDQSQARGTTECSGTSKVCNEVCLLVKARAMRI